MAAEGNGDTDLQLLKDKVMARLTSSDHQGEGPPHISLATWEALRQQLNLHLRPSDLRVLVGIEDGPIFPPMHKAAEATRDVFGYLRYNYRTTSATLTGWLYSAFSRNPAAINLGTIGMAMVLKSFHIQVGPDFLDRVGRIGEMTFTGGRESTGAGSLLASLEDYLKLYRAKTDTGALLLYDSYDSSLAFPAYQMHLAECIDMLGATIAADHSPMEFAAKASYHMIDRHWHLLSGQPITDFGQPPNNGRVH